LRRLPPWHFTRAQEAERLSQYTVHHLTRTLFWVLPPYGLGQAAPNSEKEGTAITSPSFLPLEMAGNNLGRRAEDVVGYRKASQASIEWTNTQISQMQGTKPEAVGDGRLSFEGRRMDIQLPWVAVSVTYAGFVQSADIQVHLSSAIKTEFDETGGEWQCALPSRPCSASSRYYRI
jgi:hypothetical protein